MSSLTLAQILANVGITDRQVTALKAQGFEICPIGGRPMEKGYFPDTGIDLMLQLSVANGLATESQRGLLLVFMPREVDEFIKALPRMGEGVAQLQSDLNAMNRHRDSRALLTWLDNAALLTNDSPLVQGQFNSWFNELRNR